MKEKKRLVSEVEGEVVAVVTQTSLYVSLGTQWKAALRTRCRCFGESVYLDCHLCRMLGISTFTSVVTYLHPQLL